MLPSVFFYLVTRRWQSNDLAGKYKTVVSLKPAIQSTSTSAVPVGENSNQVIARKVLRRNKMITTGFTLPSQPMADEDPNVVQVDIAFLTYIPEGELNGIARLDSITYVTLKEVIAHDTATRQKKHQMNKNAYKHFKWYSSAITTELTALGHNGKFKLVHWQITSKNYEAFLVKAEFFPAISIIIAPKKEHWFAVQPEGRAKYGTRERSLDRPTRNYFRCSDDYCANNCMICRGSRKCICLLHRRANIEIPTIDEELEDLV